MRLKINDNTVWQLSADSLLRNNFIVNVRMIVCVCVGVSRDTLGHYG